MAFNGSGTYNLPAGNPVVTGTTISSTWANTTLSDVATALTNCVTRDGQSPPTANLPMGNYKITGLGQATATGDALAFGKDATIGTLTLTNALSATNGGTGLTALGSGVATFLGTPSSANLAAAITDETGSGSLVFGTAPALTTPSLTGLKEVKTAPSISSNTLTLDCSVSNVFAVSLNANISTLTLSNVPSTGNAFALTLSLVANGTAYTVTWPASVKWPGGTAPTLTSANGKVDTFVLTTWDGGTTWYAFTAGQNA